ncbi:outer membrane usher protein [Enterobacter bugandensis]|uniref:outer membrane usher protein n=1 Tax=Enterobacter bugandensis TaxID=881260 RepID=UPI0013D760D7|nr:outer membrane usher protein [Enterobacter bugandensis]
MKMYATENNARQYILGLCISMVFFSSSSVANNVDEIQFNTDVLDVNDRENIDLSQFSRSGYIMPGVYNLAVHINRNEIPEQSISFYKLPDDPKESSACISKELTAQLGLKEDILKKLTWWHQNECLDKSSIPGMEIKGDLATSALYLSIPQAYLEYTDDNWDPPARWDDGIAGLLFDYNINMRMQKYTESRPNDYNLSGNGVAGANMGPWRLRADWQANIEHLTGNRQGSTHKLDWSRYYAYRAIPALRSKLTLGENYLDSGLFDSFRYTGSSLVSDDSMLPPNLRGYAPEVVGVAKTNARVVISQQGRILYETTVAAGPFQIQDINDTVSGELNVRVEEQDGSVQEFKVNTASIPYLARPGSVRYKLAAGQPSDWRHRTRGPLFGTGEFSWGVSNGWSLYGGGLVGGEYDALSLGLGRDLMVLGALSFDATHSRARLAEENSTLKGGSYRVSYSKDFDEYDSQVTFAGYRFSQRNFMSMSDFLDAKYYGNRTGGGKEMYTVTFNKYFRDWEVSTYLNYSHESFWDRPSNDRYNLTFSSYLNFGSLRNVSLSLSAYRNQYNGINDDGGYLSLSMPWGNSASVSYNATSQGNGLTHSASYYDRIDENKNFQLNAGSSRSGVNLSGYYNYQGDKARISTNASYHEGRYSAAGVSIEGGLTLTPEGGALHRNGMPGGTRMLIDTKGVPEVPVRGYGSTTNTNMWGKAVVVDVNSYHRSSASIDLNQLGDNAEATKSVVQATLTEGAIGYRRFDVIAGAKAMAVIKLPDGSQPPFGATVQNARDQETGIVNDEGHVYLSGISPQETMTVHWDGKAQCEIQIPNSLPNEMLMNNLLLPCHQLSVNGDNHI